MKIRKLLIAMMILIMAVCIAACSNGDTSEGQAVTAAMTCMKNGMCTEDCECPDMKDGMCPEDCMCMKEMDKDKDMMECRRQGYGRQEI